MDLTPSQILAELQAILDELAELSPGSVRRAELQERRAVLRRYARNLADASRDRSSLQRELEHLEGRLAAFKADKIEVPSWQMSMATINDPAAHATKINEALDQATAGDRESIEQRVKQLRKALAE
jgi:hypothetical protein